MVASRYWSLLLHRTDGSTSFMAVTELELRSSQGGADLTGSGTASTDETPQSGVIGNAFDNNTSTQVQWFSALEEDRRITYDFGVGVTHDIVEILLRPSIDSVDRTPSVFEVQSSSDGTNWTTEFWCVYKDYVLDTDVIFQKPTSSTARYWAMLNIVSSGGAYSMAELELRSAPGGLDKTTGQVAQAYRDFSSSFDGPKAIDDNNSTLWSSTGGAANFPWFKVDLGAANDALIVELFIRARTNPPSQTPYQFDLSYSNDGRGYIVLEQVSTTDNWASDEERVLTLSSVNAPQRHRYWSILNRRLDAFGTSFLSITEIAMRYTAGGENLVGNGTASTSKTVQSGSVAGVFDGITNALGAQWNSTVVEDIRVAYDFGANNLVEVNELEIWPDVTNDARAPGYFLVQYSDNGTDWTTHFIGVFYNYTQNVPQTFTRPTSTASRYWLMHNLTSSDVSGIVTIAEAEMRTVAGGADQTGAGTASASTTFGGFAAADAFDNANNTEWASGGEGTPAYQSLMYDFGMGVTHEIIELAITARDSFEAQSPLTISLAYSDDGKAFVNRVDFSTTDDWTASETRVFNFQIENSLTLQWPIGSIENSLTLQWAIGSIENSLGMRWNIISGNVITQDFNPEWNIISGSVIEQGLSARWNIIGTDVIEQTLSTRWNIIAGNIITQSLNPEWNIISGRVIRQYMFFPWDILGEIQESLRIMYRIGEEIPYLQMDGICYATNTNKIDVLTSQGQKPLSFSLMGDLVRVTDGAIVTPALEALPNAPIGQFQNFFGEYYNRIWVIPNVINVQNPVIGSPVGFNVWNAFTTSQELTSITGTSIDGLTFSETPPTTFTPIEYRAVSITIGADAPNEINATVNYNFGSNVGILNFRALLVNFLQAFADIPVTEQWQWLTDVIVSHNSTEQRIALRGSPRVNIEYSFILESELARLAQYARWYKTLNLDIVVPYFQYATLITAPSAQNTSQLFFDPEQTDVRDNENVVIVNPQNELGLIVELNQVNDNGATTDQPLGQAIEAGWTIAPTVTSRILNRTQLTFQQATGVMNVRADAVRIRDVFTNPRVTTTFVTHDNLIVLERRPVDQAQEVFDAGYQIIDNETGLPDSKSSWPHVLVSGPRTFLVQRIFNKADMEYWKAFFDTVRGRQVSFLFPTFLTDLTLFSVPSPGSTQMFVNEIDYTTLYFPYESFKRVRIELVNGTVIYRTILQATIEPDNSVLIELDNPFGTTTDDVDIRKISYLNRMRLDSDTVTWSHGAMDSRVQISMKTVDG